jgi:lipopolysaccharide/colanic/teichoic acid biosynthesis glycosyltransferase
VTRPQARPYDRVKRLLDVAIAGTALVASAPVQAVVAVLVARDLGRPVLFRQERPGKDGLPFTMVKFRSMRSAGDDTSPLRDAERLTPFGRLLRSTSLDELPSLWNVVKGDMSLVGPRPLLMQYLPLYSPDQARRHEVRPGLTGLAQVRGRNLVSWPERFAMDVEYVDNRSLALDLRVLAATVATVVRRSGVSSETSATMEPFTGSAATGSPVDD